LLWDGTEDEYSAILDNYFSRLSPHLRIVRTIKQYFKDRTTKIGKLPYDIQVKLKENDRKSFYEWFNDTSESATRNKRWGDFLSASSVVSARLTTSRSIHKAQGISVPAVIVTDESFFGASLSAQYVAITRMKHGLILVTNTPDTWKIKEEESFE
jgi:hypothetical protein